MVLRISENDQLDQKSEKKKKTKRNKTYFSFSLEVDVDLEYYVMEILSVKNSQVIKNNN